MDDRIEISDVDAVFGKLVLYDGENTWTRSPKDVDDFDISRANVTERARALLGHNLLGEVERWVLTSVEKRLTEGQRQYGVFTEETMRNRDMTNEFVEEMLDAIVYLLIELKKRSQ